jgi:hypothetical protein
MMSPCLDITLNLLSDFIARPQSQKKKLDEFFFLKVQLCPYLKLNVNVTQNNKKGPLLPESGVLIHKRNLEKSINKMYPILTMEWQYDTQKTHLEGTLLHSFIINIALQLPKESTA